ncbi:hypothetical protein [Sorangium sp. So ce388]|uniref:hypothetical protein n=1 Tax=Sorangium sp. So ce388 TaxID=3133309 RepID=UPI003F5B8D93
MAKSAAAAAVPPIPVTDSPTQNTSREDLENKIKKLEERIDSLSKSREWVPGVAIASISALAAGVSAYFGHMSTKNSADMTVEAAKVTSNGRAIEETIEGLRFEAEHMKVDAISLQREVDLYKGFNSYLVEGPQERRCNAVVVMAFLANSGQFMSAPNFGELATQFKCDETAKNTIESVGKPRPTASRPSPSPPPSGRVCLPTRTTMRQLKDSAAADGICRAITSPPNKYEGPFADGSVSFDTGRVIEGVNIWCNCR